MNDKAEVSVIKSLTVSDVRHVTSCSFVTSHVHLYRQGTMRYIYISLDIAFAFSILFNRYKMHNECVVIGSLLSLNNDNEKKWSTYLNLVG